MNYSTGYEWVDGLNTLHEYIVDPIKLVENEFVHNKYLLGEWYYCQGIVSNIVSFYLTNLITGAGQLIDATNESELQKLNTIIFNTFNTYKTITKTKATLLLLAIGTFHSHMISKESMGVLDEDLLRGYEIIIEECINHKKETAFIGNFFLYGINFLRDHMIECNMECIQYCLGEVDEENLH